MKLFIKQISTWAMVAILAAGCEKKEILPFYKNGNAPVLSSSTTSVAATPADSLAQVLSFSWTSPAYASDSSTYKYILQVDSAGRNFSKAVSRTVSGATSASFTAKELNAILIAYGFKSGTAYDVEARLISSYGNNNEQYISNSVAMKITPYKVPPKIPVPSELIIVGDATIGEWDNPAKDPAQAIAQRFAKLDETTYGGIFYLNGGNQYLMLPVSGNWDHKYGGTSATGGDLLVDGAVPGSNTPAPNNSGWYKIIVDFQTGKYTVTPVTYAVPLHLYGIGDATPVSPSWNNSNVGGQEITRLNSTQFRTTMQLAGGKSLKFISTIGSWQPQFGKGDADGKLGANYGGGSDPGTIDPASDGNYLIEVDFMNNTYKLTKQ